MYTNHQIGRAMTDPEPQGFDPQHLEMTLLGWAITWPNQFYEIQDLQPEHFAHPACRKLFIIMRDLYVKHGFGAISTSTIIAKEMTNQGWREEDAFTLITELNDYSPESVGAVSAVKAEVVKQGLQRCLAQASDEIKVVADVGNGTPAEIASEASSIVHQAISSQTTVVVKSMTDEMEAEIARTEDIEEGKFHADQGYSTGLGALDHILGGLHNGEMVVIGARPSIGKSAMLGSIVHSLLLQGLPGLVISMEMRAQEYAMRMISHTSGINLQFVRNRMLNPEQREKYIAHAREWADKPWWLYDQGAVSIDTVAILARRLYHEHAIKWVGIDYLQLMDHRRARNENDNSAITRTSKGIKSLSLSLDIPIIALCQLNRECENRDNKRPRLSDLRDSGALEQDCDVAMFIFRESMYYTQDEREEHKHDPFDTAEIIVAKQRNGPIGTARVAFYKESARFSNIPDGGLM